MKIRKAIQIMAAVLSLALLAACSPIPEPVKAASERVSDECRPYAEQAVRIYDQYLGFEITRDAAAQAMKDLWARAQYLDGRYEFGVNWRILMDIQFGHLDFSEFLGKTDEDIQKAKFRMEKALDPTIIVPADAYNGEYIYDLKSIWNSVGAVSEFFPVGYVHTFEYDEYDDYTYEQTSTSITLNRALVHDYGAIRDDVVRYAEMIQAGDTAPGSIYYEDGEYDIASLSIDFGSEPAEIVTVSDGQTKYAYLFGATEEDEALYKKTDEHPYGSDVVYYQPDPLSPEEIADFFLACLPE